MKTFTKLAAAAAISLASSGAFAVTADTDTSSLTGSTIGATSATATLDVGLNIGDLVALTGLDGLQFPNLTTVGASVGDFVTDNVCAYSTTPTAILGGSAGGYFLTATSLYDTSIVTIGGTQTATASDMAMGYFDGTTWSYIPYLLEYNDGFNIGTLTQGIQTEFSEANQTDPTCGGGFPHAFEATISAANVNAVGAGIYLDTVTILVEAL